MHLVTEANRILKKGGYICVTTPNVLYHVNLLKFLFGHHPFGWSVYTHSYADRHNREYTPLEAQKLLEAGGFTVELLQTQTHKAIQNWKIKVLGYALSLPAALRGRVNLKLRGQEIQVLAKKVTGVVDRYPQFLYELFGESAVNVKVGKPAHS